MRPAGPGPAVRPVFLALGANLGDREALLRAALARLAEVVRIDAVSSVYATEPVGFRDQPDFLNLVVAGRTALLPRALLQAVLAIESDLGRVRTFRDAPRTVDIDILLHGDAVIDEPGLTIPHPRMRERAFVLAPLAEVAPTLRHPVTGETAAELAEAVGREGLERLYPGTRLLPGGAGE